jgi:Skp family chaperone for outer membrane proteins
MTKQILIVLSALFILTAAACTQHRVEVAPVEVKPIHITIDVNVKVAQDLNDFFKDIDAQEEKIYEKATSQ